MREASVGLGENGRFVSRWVRWMEDEVLLLTENESEEGRACRKLHVCFRICERGDIVQYTRPRPGHQPISSSARTSTTAHPQNLSSSGPWHSPPRRPFPPLPLFALQLVQPCLSHRRKSFEHQVVMLIHDPSVAFNKTVKLLPEVRFVVPLLPVPAMERKLAIAERNGAQRARGDFAPMSEDSC